MANEKLCLKDYLKCADDKKLTKTRRKVNAKSHKKRVYGVDRAYTAVDGNLAPVGGASASAGAGGAVGESMSDGVGMHNGALPGVVSAETLGGVQAAMSDKEDTKKENKRNAPKKMSLNQFLRYRIHAENEEEDLDDEMFERIKKLMDGGIDDPEDIADSLGIDVEEVQKYIDDVEGDINPDEDDDYDDVEDPEDHVDDDDMDIGDIDADDEMDPDMDDEMDDEEDPYDSMAAAMMGDEEDPDMDDEDFTGGIADDDEYEDFEDGDPDEEDMDDEDFEDEDDDMEELDFEKDDREEHDLDDEFRSDDEKDDEFDDEDDDYDEDEEDMSPLRRAISDFRDEDEPMNDFDRLERNRERDPEYDAFSNWEDNQDDEIDSFATPNFNPDLELDPITGEPVGAYPENEEDFDEEDPEMDMDDEEYEDDDQDFDGFDKAAKDMIDSLSDDTIDDIDDVTGSVAKWWREQVVSRPVASEDDFEEEQEETIGGAQTQGPPKIDRARLVFQRMINQPDSTRSDIIAAFVNEVDVTQSTAVSYYERLAKEAGITGDDDAMGAGMEQGTEMDMTAPDMSMGADMHDDFDDEVNDMDGEGDRRGIIRTVDDAHLVYKRQTDDGSFEELWVYNVGSGIKDELKIRRAILAGTDIPSNRTESEDGSQSYRLETMGNAQMLHITGLPN